jgi:hypothetical protein
MRIANLLACVAALAWLSACTFVCIRGDGNTISDTGGHGGVSVPEKHDTLRDRLKSLQQ